VYPSLSHMALDYLTIPATSINVECLFIHGYLIVTHTHSHLSAQSTCALLCLGAWSLIELVKTEDVLAVSTVEDVEGNEEALEDGFNSMTL
ncbi:hypothetical protein PAXRUDRAFT_165819, partial [Paxillus rubicundulus Ve08.2h10]